MADRDHRRAMAAAHARRAHDPDTVAEPGLQLAQQLLRAGELAAEAVAHPHRDRGRRLLVVHDDVEMGVERGDLVDLDQRQPHLFGERRQMACMQATEMILQQMQMLDQQVAPALAITEQCLNYLPKLPDRPGGLWDGRDRAGAPSPGECGGRVSPGNAYW